MKKYPNIPSPSKAEIEKRLAEWKNEKYLVPENSVLKLFSAFPLNNAIEDILIKVYALNSAYSAYILSPLVVAKHIKELSIDDSLSKDDSLVVNKIADVEMSNGRRIKFYSFATKYCSFHRPVAYPIYDSYVVRTLMYFKHQDKDKFTSFTRDDLKNFEQFKDVILKFRESYNLESFSLREIDKYLWLVGKEYF